MRAYWYAPFDNASESDLAAALVTNSDTSGAAIELTVHSCSHRFRAPLDPKPAGRYTLVRDLPPPAGELGERRTVLRQLVVVIQRAARRRRLVRSGGFDVVHLHTFNLISDWWSLPRLRKYAPLLVQSVHDVRPQLRRLPRWLETALLGRGYRACHGILVAHEHLRGLLVDEFGVREERVRIVPLPVLTLPGLRQRRPRTANAPLHVLFFGTFRENKGMRVLLDAVEQCRTTEELTFTFAGRGDAELEAAVLRASDSNPRVGAEVGYITDERRQQLLEQCDVLVLPYTRFNSQSGVLSRDAYGSCTPVIASRVGALGEAVASEGSGWLVEPGDASGLAAMFRHVLTHPDEYNSRLNTIRSIGPDRSLQQTARAISEAYVLLAALQR